MKRDSNKEIKGLFWKELKLAPQATAATIADHNVYQVIGRDSNMKCQSKDVVSNEKRISNWL